MTVAVERRCGGRGAHVVRVFVARRRCGRVLLILLLLLSVVRLLIRVVVPILRLSGRVRLLLLLIGLVVGLSLLLLPLSVGIVQAPVVLRHPIWNDEGRVLLRGLARRLLEMLQTVACERVVRMLLLLLRLWRLWLSLLRR